MAAEQNIDAERAAFELEFDFAEHDRRGVNHDLGGWYYFDDEVEAMWKAWKASAARRSVAIGETKPVEFDGIKTPEFGGIGGATSIGEDGLPEPKYPQMKVLCHGEVSEQCGYTADQMRQFRAEGIAADRRARGMAMEKSPESSTKPAETRMDAGFGDAGTVRTSGDESPQAAQGVKTWQERCGITRKPHGQVEEAMAAEIADLRAQLARQSQGGQSMINRWLELIRVWIADPMRTDYVSVNKKYLRDMASDFEFSINGSTDSQARVADLARKLIECYPDTLPSLYVDGEPVGKELVGAVRALYAAPRLSSEQQTEAPPEPEVRPCDMPACSGVSRETGSRPYCPEHREAFEEWRRERARKQQAEEGGKA